MGQATFQKTWISLSIQERSLCPGTSSNVILRMMSQHERVLPPQLHHLETAAGSKYHSTSDLSPREQLKWPSEFVPHHKRGLTLLFQLCRDPAIKVRNGEQR